MVGDVLLLLALLAALQLLLALPSAMADEEVAVESADEADGDAVPDSGLGLLSADEEARIKADGEKHT